jgi:hypothetical protein
VELDKDPFETPSHMYTHLIKHGYTKTTKDDLLRKVRLHNPDWTEKEGDTLKERFKGMRRKLPSKIINTHTMLVLNSLPSDRRMSKAFKLPKRKNHPLSSDYPCRLCEGHDDNWRHIYSTECETYRDFIETARQAFVPDEPLSTLCTNHPSFLMNSLPHDHTKDETLVPFVMCVNWATWKTYHDIRHKGVENTQFTKTAMKHLASLQSHWETRDEKRKGKKALRDIEAREKISKIPEGVTIAYTDGSADPNPGPCGAGAYVTHKNGNRRYLTQGLGHGTNNKGELWQVSGMMLRKRLRRNLMEVV